MDASHLGRRASYDSKNQACGEVRQDFVRASRLGEWDCKNLSRQ